MINWQAPEYEERVKDVSWYWITIILAVGLLTFTIWQKNVLFGVFIVIAEVLVLTWGYRPPQMVNFEVTDKDLVVAKKKYPLGEIRSWSLNHDDGDDWADLAFHFANHLRMELRMKLPPVKISELERHLENRLQRIQHEHSVLEGLERLLRF